MERHPEAITILAQSVHQGTLRAQIEINDLLGKKMEEVFGKSVLDLFVESKSRVPGFELAIYQGHLSTGESSIMARILFRDQLIAEKQYVIQVKEKTPQ